MPLSQLDPVSALVIIDLQKAIASMPTAPHPASEVIARSAKLAAAYRAKGWPVVLVNVKGGAPGRTDAGPMGRGTPAPDWADLVPELNVQSTDYLVTKLSWGAFTGNTLDLFLRRKGVTQIILTGIATTIGVESTARSAHELGYNVVLVTDAMSDSSGENHQHSVDKVFPRLGETTLTEEVLKAVESVK